MKAHEQLKGNHKWKLVAFDIETGGLGEDVIRANSKPYEAFDPAGIKTGNVKDAGKLAEKLELARAAHAQAEAAYYKRLTDRAALDATTGEILALGILWDEGRPEILEGAEAQICKDFWARWEASQCAGMVRWVGWNIFEFDLPFLVQRSWLHGVRVPLSVRCGRRWYENFIDLMKEWACGVYGSFASLGAVGKFLGFGGKSEEMSGAAFAKYWRGDQKERLMALRYLKRDLELTRKVGERICMQVMQDKEGRVFAHQRQDGGFETATREAL